MPASLEEKQQSLEESIVFKSAFGISDVDGSQVTINPCKQVLDDNGNFNPIYGEEEETLHADTIILCIGQSSDLSYLPDNLKSRGWIKSNYYKVTDKVYAAGDMLKPTIVIDAIAQGKSAAEVIDADLGGQGLYIGESIEIPERVLNIRTFDDDLREEALQSVTTRIHNFDEVSHVYSLEDALYESERCMRCDRNSKANLLLGR